jgi:hypothetical protein
LRLAGPGEAIYLNRHWFKPYRAVADDLVLSRLERKSSLRAGQATAPLAALLIPEAGHAETAAAKLSILSGPKETACLATDGYLAAANFEAASRTCVFTQTRLQTIPIYEGVTSEVTGQVHRCEVTIGAGSACLHRSVRNLAVEGHVRIDVTVRGEIHVANIGDQPARVEVVSGQARGRPLQLSPGDIQVL